MCAVLEHKNIKRTLQYHINDNRKKFIKDVRQELGSNFDPTSLGQSNHKELVGLGPTNLLGQNNLKNLTYNQGKFVYLSEPGLYQLIAHVRDFRELVYRVILPDIGRDLMTDIISTPADSPKILISICVCVSIYN